MPVGTAIGVGAGVALYNGYQADKNMDAAMEQNDKATTAQTEIMNKQFELAESQWDTYMKTFQPINEMLASDARKGVKADYDNRLSEVNVDVEMATSASEKSTTRNMLRYGINPNDPRFADMKRKSGIDKAKMKVGAFNNARQNERDRSEKLTWAKRIDVANMGKSVPSSALTALNGASGSANGIRRGAVMNADIARMQAKDGYQLAGGITNLGMRAAGYSGKPGAWGSPAGNGWEGKNVVSSGDGADWYSDDGGFSGYADGGLIEKEPEQRKPVIIGGRQFGGEYGLIDGPGSGVSDSVQAVVDGYRQVNLSDGEFIIPADVVKKKGTEFFEKLIDSDQTKSKKV